MLLIMIRAVFVLVVAGLAVRISKIVGEQQLANPYLVFVGMLMLAIIFVVGDLLTPRKRIQTISAVYFGIIVGVLLSDLIRNALEPTLVLYLHPKVHSGFTGFMMICIVYVCVSTLLQTKDDFRFIIPYMEFSKEVKGARPLVLDTSVVIDGPQELSFVVPEGHVLVDPDARSDVRPSNGLVLVPREQIAGRAWARMYPLWERQILH